jgi:segregation and condensation protein B
MNPEQIKNIVEAGLLAAVHPLSVDNLMELFEEGDEHPERAAIRAALSALQEEWSGRGVELVEVSSGFRFQVRKEYSRWIGRLWTERPARYSRALLETLALIAYRQPITRGEIEQIRGVTLSSSIMKTLLEREWIRVVGHRDVPGRPAMYATTRGFLDDFNLKSLDELPPLSEIHDLDSVPDLFSQVGGRQGGGEIEVDADAHADTDPDTDAETERSSSGLTAH